jgi:hypothetical protein
MKWSSKIEEELGQYKCKCNAYKYLCLEASKLYSYRNTLLGVSNIVIISFTAFTNSIDVNVENSQSVYDAWGIITKIIPFFAALTSGFQLYFKYAEKSKDFEKSNILYNALYNSIHRELLLEVEERKPADVYYEWFVNEYDTLYKDTLQIPHSIIKAYEKESGTIFSQLYQHDKVPKASEQESIIQPMHTTVLVTSQEPSTSSSNPKHIRKHPMLTRMEMYNIEKFGLNMLD